MIDIDIIRDNPERFKEVCQQKNVKLDVDKLLELDAKRRERQQAIDELARKRNELSKKANGKPDPETIEAGKKIKEQLNELEEGFTAIEEELAGLLNKTPNLPSDDTPVGPDESGNQVLRKVGEIPKLDFKPKAHWDLGEDLGIIDTETAAKVTGSRFAYLKGPLAQMQFALVNYALSVLTDGEKITAISEEALIPQTSKPFTVVIPPVMVRSNVMQKMARLEPKDERYHIVSDNLYLVGSAEHTLGPMHMKENLPAAKLPLRYVGYSTSFRREAGSHGRDVRGILRLHQFDKLEIESITTPEDSDNEQKLIVAIQEHLMQGLKLPYQVVLKCTGDQGTPDYRAIDIETWLPGQGTYRETHTSDHMTDYQARRLRTKVKLEDGESVYVHMNDATVFAIGRTLIAIMENYQQEDGSIKVPEVLQQFLPFKEISK